MSVQRRQPGLSGRGGGISGCRCIMYFIYPSVKWSVDGVRVRLKGRED